MAQFNSLTDRVRQMLGGMVQQAPKTLSDIGNAIMPNFSASMQGAKTLGQNVSYFAPKVAQAAQQFVQQPDKFNQTLGQNIKRPGLGLALQIPVQTGQAYANILKQGIPSALKIGSYISPGLSSVRMSGVYPQLSSPITGRDVLKTAGLAGMGNLTSNIIGGGIGAGIKAIENIGSKKPIGQDVGKSYREGVQFSSQLAPVEKLTSWIASPTIKALSNKFPVFNKVVNKLTPGEVKDFTTWVTESLKQGNKSGLAMSVFGALQDSKNGQETLKNIWDQYKMGFVFGAGGKAVGNLKPGVIDPLREKLKPMTLDQKVANQGGFVKLAPGEKPTLEQLKADIANQAKNKPNGFNPIEDIPGTRPGLRAEFDNAIARQDMETIQKLLPEVPDAYKKQVGKYLDPILSKISANTVPVDKVAQTGQVQPQEVAKATTTSKPQLQEVQSQKSVGDVLSNGQQNPSSPDSIPEVDPVQKIITALKGAKPIRGQQEAIYSKIRSQQAGALAGIGGQLKGEAGYYQKLGQLKGEMPKVQFESIKKQFTQDDLNSLFNKVESSNLGVFEKVNAQTGLRKLLGAEGGTIPTEGELQLLNEVFPPEFIQAVLDNRSTMQKLFTLGENALNLPRAMMATADLSAPLRQGAFLIGRPKQWLPAFRDMFKYAFSENAYKGLQDEIKARPSYQLMRENKLAITDMSPLLQSREEAFMSNLSEQIPIFGRIAKGSNRAYSGFLNKLRADTFDDLLKGAKAQGLDIKENPKLVSDIANFVNTATGRGNLGAFQKAAPILNAAMFSPRLVASRINLLNPIYYTKLEPFVRKEALKSLLSFVGTGATVLALSKLGGAEVGADPRSADFGKIKVGNTRFDIWGGFQQYVRALAQLISGQYISTTTGKTLSLGEGYNAPTRKDILLRFFESKESPVMSFVTSILEGKTATGSAFNLPVEVIDRFIPMVVQDMYDLYKEWGPKGILMGIPGGFGVGSQTYQDRIPMQGKTPMGKPNIQWRQAPSLGEELWNKATGTELSNIPKDQWAPLVEKKKQENLWNIKYSGVKAAVLETGQEQTVQNPITGDSIRVYLDNGVVKTKIITPKKPTLKLKKTSTKKVSKGKSIKIRMAKLKAPKVKRIKIAKVRIKKPLKLARMRVKMNLS